jgi:hypothetical protein
VAPDTLRRWVDLRLVKAKRLGLQYRFEPSGTVCGLRRTNRTRGTSTEAPPLLTRGCGDWAMASDFPELEMEAARPRTSSGPVHRYELGDYLWMRGRSPEDAGR